MGGAFKYFIATGHKPEPLVSILYNVQDFHPATR